MEITLTELLASRDNRVATQQSLREKHPHSTLVCLTVIMPGNVKRNLHSLIVAHAALNALLKALENEIVDVKVRDLATGYEAYLLTSLPTLEAKRIACSIEDTHPLGRLFDIDIIGLDGTPLSRELVGSAPRRCLLCDNEARYCMRRRSHTPQELNNHITTLVNDYVRQL